MYRVLQEPKSKFVSVGFGVSPDGVLRCPTRSGGFTPVSKEFKIIMSSGKIDKKGVQIYHGDIVTAPDAHDRGDGSTDDGLGLVCYDASIMMWTLRFDDNHDEHMADWCYDISSELTVVGNIYEETELKEEFSKLDPSLNVQGDK